MNIANHRENPVAISLIAAIGGLLFGYDTAVISGAIGWVKVQFPLSIAMEGWLVSSGLLGCIAGVLITGLISDRIGRKKVLFLAGALFLLSGLGCAFSPSLSIFIFTRFIGGVGVGMASVISPMYIAEFAPAEKRGKMISYYQLAITVGILLAYLTNAILVKFTAFDFENSLLKWFFQTEVWRPMFLAMAIPSLVFIYLLLRVPESPRWLQLNQNKKNEKLDSASTAKQAKSASTIKLSSPSIRLPLLIGVLLAVFQQFSGINAIIYYGPSIFETAGIGKNDALFFQSIVGVINLVFTFVAIKTADKLGRKFLLVGGLIGMIASLTACGFIFYTGVTASSLLLFFILLFIACFAMSVGPITWVLINEIFPNNVRVKAVSLCTLVLWIAVWIVGQFFPWMLKNAGAANTFFTFAFFCILNLIFCYRLVKETKNKTLEELEEIYISPH